MSMKDNVVIITGASTGIGEELAYRLAKQGAKLVLTARRLDELNRVAETATGYGARVITVSADVAKSDECKKIIDAAIAEFGRIDTLMCNAGMTMWAKFADIDDVSILERIMQVNYMGAVYCTHHALPHLLKTKGRIVGIASLTGLVGVPTRTGYAASKHAMRGFFDSLRIELDESGVSVTMVYPGFVATGIRENATGADGKAAKIDPVNKDEVMSVDECARIIEDAIVSRKREEIMTLKGKVGQWIKLIAPGFVDGLAKKAVAGNLKYVEKK
ncbi:MAG: SDR family oxidoreductase [Betaproteobacteria bacterium]|nr:SDR family oxidoreductase [Betaproteobacteria bacterium]